VAIAPPAQVSRCVWSRLFRPNATHPLKWETAFGSITDWHAPRKGSSTWRRGGRCHRRRYSGHAANPHKPLPIGQEVSGLYPSISRARQSGIAHNSQSTSQNTLRSDVPPINQFWKQVLSLTSHDRIYHCFKLMNSMVKSTHPAPGYGGNLASEKSLTLDHQRRFECPVVHHIRHSATIAGIEIVS
jgi:hypothetical protein